MLDVASRRILGFALSEHHDAQLAYGALAMAATVRGGQVAGVIMHTDQGSPVIPAACVSCPPPAGQCPELGCPAFDGLKGEALRLLLYERSTSLRQPIPHGVLARLASGGRRFRCS